MFLIRTNVVGNKELRIFLNVIIIDGIFRAAGNA